MLTDGMWGVGGRGDKRLQFLAYETGKPAVSCAGVGDSVGKRGFTGKTDVRAGDLQ